jgi:hypothetical protein
MRKYFLPLFIMLAAAAAQAAEPVPQPEKRITAESFLDRVKTLSGEKFAGREAGAPGCAAAAEYIASALKEIGAPPGGDCGSYFQRFTFPGRPVFDDNAGFTVTSGEWTLRMKRGADYAPMSISGKGNVKGQLAFAGYGISAPDEKYDDYADFDARGKVLLVFRHTPRESRGESPQSSRGAPFAAKALEAARRGAAALIILTDPANHENEPDELVYDAGPSESASIPVLFITRGAAKRLVSQAGLDLKEIQKTIDGAGKPHSFDVQGVTVEIAVRVARTDARTENVVAVFDGSDAALKNECVIIGAHYDHIGANPNDRKRYFPGADDNASGSAALLEIARALGSMEKKPKRSIVLVWFSAEEKGLFGSRWYCEHPRFPLSATSLMVNLDMLGRSKGDVMACGTVSADGLKEIIENASAGLLVKVRPNEGLSQSSDCASFYAKKIPSIFFCTGMHSDLHKETDTADKINAGIGVELAVLALRVAVAAADGPALLAYKGETAPRGGRMHLGVSGVEPADGGVKIGMVIPHTPASDAGLVDGDVIAAINGKETRSFEDVRKAVSEFKAGEPITITVVRDGKKIDLHANAQERFR